MLEDGVERLCCTSLPSRRHALYKMFEILKTCGGPNIVQLLKQCQKLWGQREKIVWKIWGQAKQAFLSKKWTQRNLTKSYFKITFKKDE